MVLASGGEEDHRPQGRDVDVEQTFLKFVDPAVLDSGFRKRVATEVVHKDWSLFWCTPPCAPCRSTPPPSSTPT